MLVRCQRRYRAGIKVISGWTEDDFVTGSLQTIAVGLNRQKAEIRPSPGAPVVLWTLYNVQVKALGAERVYLSGIEPIETSRGTRWVYQFWNCELVRPEQVQIPASPRFGDAIDELAAVSAWKRSTGLVS